MACRRVLSWVAASVLLAAPATAGASVWAKWDGVQGGASWTAYAQAAVDQYGAALWKAGFNPADVTTYCPAYPTAPEPDRKAFWVGFLSALAEPESHFNPRDAYQETFTDRAGARVVSRGLLQISPESANSSEYRCGIGAPDDLYDPRTNITCAVRILAYLVPRAGAISTEAPAARDRGAAGYWHPLRTAEGRRDIARWTAAQPYCSAGLRYLYSTPAVSERLSAPPPPPPPPPPAMSLAPAPVVSASAPTGREVAVAPNPVAEPFSIVRYVGSSISNWSETAPPVSYADLYTQVQLTYPGGDAGSGIGAAADQPQANPRSYRQEQSPWIERVLIDRTDTVTTSATVNVLDPIIKVSLPLFSVSHASGRAVANTWSTNYTASNYASPLFRIGPNTRIGLQVDAAVSSDLKSQGAAVVLGALTRAVNIAAPSSTLLTTLSKTDIANTATAIDTTISSLASKTISEEIVHGRLFSTWRRGAQIELAGCAPFVRADQAAPQASQGARCSSLTDIDGRADTQVGSWAIRFACPRPSVFDVRDICGPIGRLAPGAAIIDMSDPDIRRAVWSAIAPSVTDDSVLSFNLSSQVSVQTFFMAQSWYADFLTATAKAPSATDAAPAYTGFCSAALVGLEGSGLNGFDAALVLRAAVDQLPKLVVLKANFAPGKAGAACAAQLEDYGVLLQSAA